MALSPMSRLAGATIGQAGLEIIPHMTAKGLAGLERQMNSLGRELTRKVTGPIVAAGAAMAGAMSIGVRRLSQLEQSAHGLEMLGVSAGKSAELMSTLESQLIGTVITLDDSADAMTRLVAAGMDLERVPEVMSQMMDAAAVGQVPLAEVAFAFQRVQSRGRLMSRELEILGTRIPGALGRLADAAGVTQGEFRDLVSSGEIDADRFFDLWSKASEGFAGAAQAADRTFRGSLESMRGFFALYSAQLSRQSGLWDGLKLTMQNTLDVLKDERFAENISKFASAVGEAFDFNTLGGLAETLPRLLEATAEFLGNLEPEEIRKFVQQMAILAAIGPGLLVASAGIRAVGTALLIFTPKGLLLAGLAATGAALGKAWQESDEFKAATAELGDTITGELLPAVNDLVVSLGALLDLDWESAGDAGAHVIRDGMIPALEDLSRTLSGDWSGLWQGWVDAGDPIARFIDGFVRDVMRLFSGDFWNELGAQWSHTWRVTMGLGDGGWFQRILTGGRDSWGEFTASIGKDWQTFSGWFGEAWRRDWDNVRAVFAVVVDWVGRQVDRFVGFFEDLPGRIRDALSGISFASIADAWQRATAGLSLPNPSGFSGLIPGRASGGLVFAGMPYIVGERQPELFVPEANGRIIPSVPSSWSGTGGVAATTTNDPIVLHSHLYLDGREIDVRVQRIQDERDQELVRAFGA